MAGQKRLALPAPATSSTDSQPPATLLDQLRELREAAREVGKLLDDPDQVTLGELKRRGGRLLQLLGLAR